MKVWVEQADCMGSGLCGIIEPRVFLLAEGVAHVRGADGLRPDGREGAVDIPEDCREAVFQASKSCVAACIYVE